jgi:hypothetical protein
MGTTTDKTLESIKGGETCVSWFFREPGFLPFLARHIRAFLRLGYFPGEATFWGAEGISCDSSAKKGLLLAVVRTVVPTVIPGAQFAY